VGRNQFNGFIYLAGMLTNEVFLMQYYDPLRKFMHLKVREKRIRMKISLDGILDGGDFDTS
jgi:mitogen-activated protein kinase kinase kinase kinase 3/[mitogen-activated protein kinase] kinase 5